MLNVLSFNNENYRHIGGVAMGIKMGPNYALLDTFSTNSRNSIQALFQTYTESTLTLFEQLHAGERNWKPFFTATILPSFEIVVPQFTSSSFYVSFLSRVNSTNWPAPNIWVFIAQLVEHCSVNAEAIGLNPVKVQKFFFMLICNCFNCNRHCDDYIFINFAAYFHLALQFISWNGTTFLGHHPTHFWC